MFDSPSNLNPNTARNYESSELLGALRLLRSKSRPFLRHAFCSRIATIESILLFGALLAGSVQFVRVYWLRSEWFRTAPEQVSGLMRLAADPLPGLMHMGTEFLAWSCLATIVGVGLWIQPFSGKRHASHIRFAYAVIMLAAVTTWAIWVRKGLYFEVIFYHPFNRIGMPMPASPQLPAVLATLAILAILVFMHLAAIGKAANAQQSGQTKEQDSSH